MFQTIACPGIRVSAGPVFNVNFSGLRLVTASNNGVLRNIFPATRYSAYSTSSAYSVTRHGRGQRRTRSGIKAMEVCDVTE